MQQHRIVSLYLCWFLAAQITGLASFNFTDSQQYSTLCKLSPESAAMCWSARNHHGTMVSVTKFLKQITNKNEIKSNKLKKNKIRRGGFCFVKIPPGDFIVYHKCNQLWVVGLLIHFWYKIRYPLGDFDKIELPGDFVFCWIYLILFRFDSLFVPNKLHQTWWFRAGQAMCEYWASDKGVQKSNLILLPVVRAWDLGGTDNDLADYARRRTERATGFALLTPFGQAELFNQLRSQQDVTNIPIGTVPVLSIVLPVPIALAVLKGYVSTIAILVQIYLGKNRYSWFFTS